MVSLDVFIDSVIINADEYYARASFIASIAQI